MLEDWTSDVSCECIPQKCNNIEGSFQSFNTPDKGQVNYILGGGLYSRFGKRVRQQEGLSYRIGSTQGSALNERCVFFIRAICAPDKTDRDK